MAAFGEVAVIETILNLLNAEQIQWFSKICAGTEYAFIWVQTMVHEAECHSESIVVCAL